MFASRLLQPRVGVLRVRPGVRARWWTFLKYRGLQRPELRREQDDVRADGLLRDDGRVISERRPLQRRRHAEQGQLFGHVGLAHDPGLPLFEAGGRLSYFRQYSCQK